MYEALTSTLIKSLAKHKSIDPSELDVVVADYIDLSAVEQLAMRALVEALPLATGLRVRHRHAHRRVAPK